MRVTQSLGVQKMLNTYTKTSKKTEDKIGTKDKVEISSLAKDIQIARKAFSELPEVREDLVKDIKQKIASGNYRPSAEDLLGKIISSGIN